MRKKCYEDDLYRCYGRKETFLEYLTRNQEKKFTVVLRKSQACKNKLFKFFWKYRLRKHSEKSNIWISDVTQIGRGFCLVHGGPVIINPNAIIGENVNVANGVTIGQENRGKRIGAPTIGSEVWIGTNAVIVGKINVGNDVMIAPNAFVNFDVPSHSIVVGNPGKIIHRDYATEGYINRKV